MCVASELHPREEGLGAEVSEAESGQLVTVWHAMAPASG